MKLRTPGQALSPRTARVAVLSAFFINGAVMASWLARIPLIQSRLALSEGALGLVLMGMAAGVLVALTFAGGLVARFGSRAVVAVSSLLLCALLSPLALMPNATALWINLFLFGAALSLMDVAMNAQGVDVERLAGRALMSSFHAAWSVGGFVGAGLAALTSFLGVDLLTHFLLIAVVFALAAFATIPRLLTVAGDGEGGHTVFRLPPRVLWPVGAVAFCAAIGEGAMADWSGVYLKSVVGVADGMAAFGFAAFSITMTAGRLAGDSLVTRFGPAPIVRIGGICAATGLLLAILWPQTVPVLIGFAAVGAGLSIVIPLAFSAAGKVPNLPAGVGIAAVATIGYAGFLAGPPAIGLLAEATSLQMAMLLVLALVSSLIFTSRTLDGNNRL